MRQSPHSSMPVVTPGSRLGPYEIASRLGAGGMGEVWRAKDTRLDRSVAIKFLPPELAHNPQLKIRLDREARTISQLNHPNICTLYDVGDDYLVMELLEGDTLIERISRGALPLADVLRYGEQIADALDRAHRAGVVHRDLKPGNIILTKSGAKLLDFGLARSEITTTIDTDGPTIVVQEALTEEGTVLGTFQYMAPEQLEAQPADARTDIFALGCVLYEMATGRRAFRGKTRTSLIAAIVSAQPDPISMQTVTPPAFEHVVQKCLEKDPDERWQSAHDVAEELRWIAQQLQRGEGETRAKTRVHWIVAALLALTTIAGFALWWRERTMPPEAVAFELRPPPKADFASMAVSPDGRSIAMIMDRIGTPDHDIVIRRLDDFEFRKIGTTPVNSGLVWSPDAKWIAYFQRGKLLRIPSSGGNPEIIARNVAYGVGATWNEDDTILFCPRWGDALFRVSANGGEPVRVTTLDAKRAESLHGYPYFLPDGKHFLFVVHTTGGQRNEIHLGTLDGKHQQILSADGLVGFARDSLVFVRDGAIYVQPMSRGYELEGKPKRIAENVFFSEANAGAPSWIAKDGGLGYVVASTRAYTYSWHDRAGRRIATAFAEPNADRVRFTPDGSRFALEKFDLTKGATDIYSLEPTRGVRSKVTGGLSDHNNAVWAPQGDRIYFANDNFGIYDIYGQVEDGTAPAELLWRSQDDKFATGITPDGQSLFVNVYNKTDVKGDIWIQPTDGSARRLLIGGDATDIDGSTSPDGKWLSYVSDRSGRIEVYVRRYPNGRSIQVSTDGGGNPSWSHDSSELRWTSPDRGVFAARITANGDTPVPGKPERLFDLETAVTSCVSSPTNDGFLIGTLPETITVIVNYVRREW